MGRESLLIEIKNVRNCILNKSCLYDQSSLSLFARSRRAQTLTNLQIVADMPNFGPLWAGNIGPATIEHGHMICLNAVSDNFYFDENAIPTHQNL